jgi:FkbM family methyltransferase
MFRSTTRICDHTFLPGLLSTDAIVVDLGAFDGDFAHAIIDRFHCRVISAEPVKQLLDRIVPDPLLEILPVAVGGKNQQVSVNLFDSRNASVLGAIHPDEDAGLQTVEMITLTELCRRAGTKDIDLLKIDIEGAEIELIDSCSDQELKSCTQVAVEFHDFLYPDLRPAVERIRERMSDISFWVLPFSLDSSDVLFLNKESSVSAAEVAYLRTVVRYGRGIARRLRRIAS